MKFVIGLMIVLFIVLMPFIREIRVKQKLIGVLRVDRSDPNDMPYLFLELDKGMDISTIIHSTYVIFRVKVDDFIPHE